MAFYIIRTIVSIYNHIFGCERFFHGLPRNTEGFFTWFPAHVHLQTIPNKVYRFSIRTLLVVLLILFATSEANSQNCTSGTTVIAVDLSASPTASWKTPSAVVPSDGQCCDANHNHRCLEFLFTLHPDANGINIAFTVPVGSVYYHVNCSSRQYVSSNIINICFDKGDVGPHSVTFCRSGMPSYEFTVKSIEVELEVTLEPYAPLCIDAPGFMPYGGSPAGGMYYLNGSAAPFINPALLGAGDYELAYHYEDPVSGCMGFAVQTLSIKPLPVISWVTESFCADQGMVTLNGASPPGGVYSGTFVSANTFDVGSAIPGNFEVTYYYEDAFGCSRTSTGQVTVNPLPIADAGPDLVRALGSTVALTAASGGTGSFSYSWSPSHLFVNPNVQNPTTIPLFASTAFTLTVTNYVTGCSSTDEVVVRITGGDLQISSVHATPSVICRGDETRLSVLAGGGNGAYTYHWTANPATPGFPSTAPSPMARPTTTTVFTVVVSQGGLTPVSSSVTVQVNDLPDVFLDNLDPYVCANTPGYKITGGSHASGSYFMTDLDTLLLKLPYINFNNFLPNDIGQGKYLVGYSYTDPATGCSNTTYKPFEIKPWVKAQFYASRADICISNEITLANHSSGATSLNWNFGDGTTGTQSAPSFLHTFPDINTTTTYNITLTAHNNQGCSDQITRQVKVFPSATASISSDIDRGCSDLDVNFTSTPDGPVRYHLWDFGDGTFSMGQNVAKTFTNRSDADTTFWVKLSVLSMNYFCVFTDSVPITVYPYVEAQFTTLPAFGCHPLEVEPGNLAWGGPDFFWDFGNGITSTDADPGKVLFTNTTNDVVSYTIRQRVSNRDCSHEVERTIEVYPAIQADFSTSDTLGCSPLEVDFGNLSSETASHFTWEFDDGGSSMEMSPRHIFENFSDTTQTFQVWMHARTDYFCRDSARVEIRVHPFIKAGFDFAPAQICNGEELTFVNTAIGALDYSWDLGNGTLHSLSDNSFTHIFTHDDPDPVIYPISLRVENAQGCWDNLVRPLTVFPKIEASFATDITTGCPPLTVEFTDHSLGVFEHQWEFGDGGSANTPGGVLPLNHTFYNSSFKNDTVYTVWMHAVSPWLCRDSMTVDITVYPKVLADFSIENSAGCSPLLVEFGNHSAGFETLSWDFNNGSTSNDTLAVLNSLFENLTSDVLTFDVRLSALSERGCPDERLRTVTVYPEVNISYTHEPEGCHPLPVSFDNSHTENASYFAWEFGDKVKSGLQSPDHVFHNFSHTSETVFDVSLFASSIYGCFSTAQSQVRVFPKPASVFSVPNSPGCSPHEIIMVHSSVGATDYVWDFGDTSPFLIQSEFSDTITHLYNLEPGFGERYFSITLFTENAYNCLDTLVQQVLIYPNIIAEFATDLLEGCHPLTVNFTNQSYGATAMSPFQWNYGNGNTSQNLLPLHGHTFLNYSHTRDTIYEVVLTAYNTNGCLHTDTVNITVFPQPKALFTIPNTSGCAPHDLEVNNESVGALNFQWLMGTGDTLYHTGENFQHTYYRSAGEGPGIFTVHLYVENATGCSGTHEQQVTIYPEVAPRFSAVTEGCHPHTTTFENTSVGGDMFIWNFDNGSTSHQANPQQMFVNYSHTENKIYTVRLYAESVYGCNDYAEQEIVVWPIPAPLFQLSPFTGCSPHMPEIANLSVGATQFHWDLGNGESQTTDSLFTHTWTNTGQVPVQYPLSLTVWNDYGCEAKNLQKTTVFPEVTAAFTTTDNVWQGCSPFTVKFANSSLLSDSYRWDFDDGSFSNSAAPLHIFENLGMENRIFPVEMVATSIFGCRDTIVRDVTVFPSPQVEFTAQPKKQPYPNATVTFTNLTNPGNWNFTWEYGDGNNTHTPSDAPHQHTYVWDENDMSTKHYVVALMATNGQCSGMFTQDVTITSPVPNSVFTSVTSGCQPFTVQFSNHSMYAHSYKWIFGDGGVSADPAPRYTFMDPGYYEVKLVATGDGGRDTSYHYIEVFENPRALFEIVTPYINIPQEPLQVRNHSNLGDFYQWHFGDGNISYDFEPEYYYTEPGIYDIMLVTSRSTDPVCVDTLLLKNSLRVEETCQILFPNAFMPDPAGPSSGSFDMNNPSTTIFHPVYEGVSDYVLQIFNRWGELIFRTEDINIGWDGYYRGKLSPIDVYVWKVNGRCTDGRSIILQGDVTLYR